MTADTAATILAVLTGAGGIVAAVGGVLLTIRKVRTKEQEAAEAALATVEGLLAEERKRRIEVERKLYDMTLTLAQHGIPTEDR